MKTKGIILSLMASTLVNIPQGFAKEYVSSSELTQSKKVKFDIFPVKFSKSAAKNSFDFNGNHLIPLTKKPSLTLEDFQFHTLEEDKIGIRLVLDEATGDVFEALTRKYINTKLAIVYEGQVLLAPTVKSVISGGQLEMTFKDPKKFEEILTNLNNG